ncbi:hypothetical protein C5L29_003233 [Lactiplantibacillus pentosus]|nr:hypothetical protein C5L29_003233 [Lactiplantibacillus pentosus]
MIIVNYRYPAVSLKLDTLLSSDCTSFTGYPLKLDTLLSFDCISFTGYPLKLDTLLSSDCISFTDCPPKLDTHRYLRDLTASAGSKYHPVYLESIESTVDRN